MKIIKIVKKSDFLKGVKQKWHLYDYITDTILLVNNFLLS